MTVGVSYASAQALYVGERIKRRRLQLGIYQRELARRMHLDPSLPQLWESNKRPVPYAQVGNLAAALQMTIAQLIGRADLPKDPRDVPLMTQVDVFSLPIKPFFEPLPEPPPRPLPLIVNLYRKACWSCGHEEFYRLNEKQAQAAVLLGRMRCAACGSAGVELVEAEKGGYSGQGKYGRGVAA